MDRPRMDRPREVKGTPFTREAGRLLKAGLLITAVVLAVGSLPVILLWFWADDLEQPAGGLAYVDEELTIRSGDVELAARLRLPAFGGPHPALVVAHGSGRATRDDYAGFSEILAINGYALLTYDKRGVGDSGGTYTGVGPANSDQALGQLADDVVAGVEALKQRPDIRADRIGVYGISQGGWIAPLTAAKSPDVSFMVIVSGPTVTVGEEIYYSELTGEREGARDEGTDSDLSERLAAYEGPHGFDPVIPLETIDIPGLWVLGDADRSIPIPETVAILDRLAASGKPYSHQVLAGVGHGMRNVRSGESAPVFAYVFPWLVEHAGAD